MLGFIFCCLLVAGFCVLHRRSSVFTSPSPRVEQPKFANWRKAQKAESRDRSNTAIELKTGLYGFTGQEYSVILVILVIMRAVVRFQVPGAARRRRRCTCTGPVRAPGE